MKFIHLAFVLIPMISNVEPRPQVDQRLTNIKIDLITQLEAIPGDTDLKSEDKGEEIMLTDSKINQK